MVRGRRRSYACRPIIFLPFWVFVKNARGISYRFIVVVAAYDDDGDGISRLRSLESVRDDNSFCCECLTLRIGLKTTSARKRIFFVFAYSSDINEEVVVATCAVSNARVRVYKSFFSFAPFVFVFSENFLCVCACSASRRGTIRR